MDEFPHRWRPRAWQVVVAAIAVLLLAAWVTLLAIRRHNEHVWAKTVPALEAAGFACRIEGWAAEAGPVDAAPQERLWLALKALPDIPEPAMFTAWIAGKAADPGPDTARLLADHAAAIADIIGLVRAGARADMSGWIAADLAAGKRPPANRLGSLLGARSVANWLRVAALVERSPERAADLERWSAALGHGPLIDAMIAVAIAETVDRTRLAFVERGIADEEATRPWLDAPSTGRDLLRRAWRGERVYELTCFLGLDPSLLRAELGLWAADPRAWWQWAVLPDGTAHIARWFTAEEAAAGGGAPPALPHGIGGAGCRLVEMCVPNLHESSIAVAGRCSAARMHRLAARLIFAARRSGRVAATAAEAEAVIAPATFAADDECCAVRFLVVGAAGFRLEADLASPPLVLPPPRRVAAVEVIDALRVAPAAAATAR